MSLDIRNRISEAGCRKLDVVCWILGTGYRCWILETGYKKVDIRHWISKTVYQKPDFGCGKSEI